MPDLFDNGQKDPTTVFDIIARIREVTGLGHKPMLSELPEAIGRLVGDRDARIAELEAAFKWAYAKGADTFLQDPAADLEWRRYLSALTSTKEPT